MKYDTYEEDDSGAVLERYEWDQWLLHEADNQDALRVLYIGDSISGGIFDRINVLAKDEIIFDNFKTSKAVDNPFFKESLHLFGLQQKRRDLIIFNNGLHGWHLEDEREYGFHYEKMVQFLLQEFTNVPLALILSTSVVGERNERVIKRNSVVKRIAGKYDLPVIDLFRTSEQWFDLISADGVHYTAEGADKLTDTTLSAVRSLLL